jgi:hypothetical protein
MTPPKAARPGANVAPLTQIEAALIEKAERGNPADYVAVTTSAMGLDAVIEGDGRVVLIFRVRMPQGALRIASDVLREPGAQMLADLGLSNSVAARRVRAALGLRPLVRLVVRRDALGLPPAAPAPPAITGPADTPQEAPPIPREFVDPDSAP